MLLKYVLAAALLLTVRDARCEETPEPPAPPAPQTTSLRGLFLGGARYARVFDVGMGTVQLGVGLDARRGSLGVIVLPELDLGRTLNGLSTGRVGLTFAFDGTVGRFGLGGGLLAVTDWLANANALGVGATFFVHGDVVRLGSDRAVFMMVRGDGTLMHGLGGGGDSPMVLSASLGLGVRF